MTIESTRWRLFHSLCFALLLIGGAHADITAAFTTAPGATYSGVAAYNPATLVAPPVPSPSILTTIPVQLQNAGTPNLSIKQKGSFFGFSIEMSVTNQVLGKNSTLIQVPFLNLMANIQQRAGSVTIRVGGNTQESAKLVDSLPNGRILMKDLTGVTGRTQTPPLDFSRDLLYLMRNISSFVNVHWFLGIPWFETKPFDLAIVKASDEILGDYLLGLQAANEPDMYALHNHRNGTIFGPNGTDYYKPYDYMQEISSMLTQMDADGADPTGRAKTILVGPNSANFNWTMQEIWDAGFVDKFADNLAYLAVEKYPTDNCDAVFGGANAKVPQAQIAGYLTHNSPKGLVSQYLASTAYAQTKNKPFLMFETNTASCGGFNGVSDSFTAALWGLDYAMQMAYSNFSGAHFHLGGQNVFYNPFTSPPTNQSTFHQWSVGPLYYSALVMAEAMGPSNKTQILDLPIPNISPFTPIYGIYENGTPVRIAIFNYVDDPSGANTVHAVISMSGASMPKSVKVKYLLAKTVVQKGGYTWANQTFGGNFESDGRPMGSEQIQTVNCDTTAQTCTIDVPAPGFALVFLTDAAFTENSGAPSVTFATTAQTKTHNTATVDPSVLSTSNGYRMDDHELAGTSKAPSAALRSLQGPLITLGLAIGTIAVILGWAI
ncbi:glycoside hydrolase family 79 protein [Mycena capillaripes]|nr:glycoside hydrolase family 79 protein [Mycena capillaripes]